MDISGSRLAFITGASSGIGQALAQRFHAAGWRLALVARRGDAIERWVAAAGIDRSRLAIYAADVRDIDAITAAGRACIAEHGVADVVIANAGISVGIDTADRADLDVLRTIYETNNIGMAATFQPFVEAMRERRCGTLVGIASVAGIRGLPGHGGYCASKAAAIGYCESLRGEMRPFGVGVVTISPGYIDTPMTRSNRHPMPFLISAERFAEQAFRSIQAQKRYVTIPWQMGIAAMLLRAMPNKWFDRLMANQPRKRRRQE